MSQTLIDVPKDINEIPRYIDSVINQGKDLNILDSTFTLNNAAMEEIVGSVGIFVEKGETNKEFINTFVVNYLTGYQAGRNSTH